MNNYAEWKTEDLIKEINRFDKKLDKIKTAGACWALGCGITAIRSELDKRFNDTKKVTSMIMDARP